MKVDTTRFGQLDIPEERLIAFSRGIIGFPGSRRFFLLDYKDTDLKWLQAADDPDLAFLMVDPLKVFADFRVDVSAVEREILGVRDSGDCKVFCILNIVSDGDEKKASLNLLGPIVINPVGMRGLQLVMEKSRYSAQEPVRFG